MRKCVSRRVRLACASPGEFRLLCVSRRRACARRMSARAGLGGLCAMEKIDMKSCHFNPPSTQEHDHIGF
ncbi:hypothetical protein scyTo_0000589 [Scyliorhinus torazame]|uniref:Uncharacterized protein n=1 Tax=Scyliorhinus torazame TaxID=75743 RepID=A0A401NZY6_SCYTO|nr:hypothetical protein [Scyliorhinus torazame]